MASTSWIAFASRAGLFMASTILSVPHGLKPVRSNCVSRVRSKQPSSRALQVAVVPCYRSPFPETPMSLTPSSRTAVSCLVFATALTTTFIAMPDAQTPAAPAAPTAPAAPAGRGQQPAGPDMNRFYTLGPDSLERGGVPKGELGGPCYLPNSPNYPGTQHTYWVHVPAQYDPAVETDLMIFQDGQAFIDMNGSGRVPNVMDNLIYRRELP